MSRRGYWTTEFWLSLLGAVGGFYMVQWGGHADIGVALLATSIPGYAVSRGIAKR